MGRAKVQRSGAKLSEIFNDERLAKLEFIEPIHFQKSPELSKRFLEIISTPDILDTICSYVASGGTIVTLANCWDIRFGDLSNWLHKEPERSKRYRDALEDRTEWAMERLLRELRSIALSDIKQLFNEDGAVLPVSEWPDSVSRAISSIEVDELWGKNAEGKNEQIGTTKKVKFWDKLRALELIGKNVGMFVDRHVHEGKLTLEHLVAQASKPLPPESKP